MMQRQEGHQEQEHVLRYRYQVPQKLQVEDVLVSLGPISLTLRQTVILMLGGCLSLQIFRHLSVLALPTEITLCLVVLPALLSAFIALVKLRGRYGEVWLVLWWRYLHLPKTYVWRQEPGIVVSTAVKRAETRSPARRGKRREEEDAV